MNTTAGEFMFSLKGFISKIYPLLILNTEDSIIIEGMFIKD